MSKVPANLAADRQNTLKKPLSIDQTQFEHPFATTIPFKK
ncbi:MAG: hypothetical protein FCKEOINB_02715 [Nitrosomonas sp.]|nr:hypothetical protein [Nitrosomonas sp.]